MAFAHDTVTALTAAATLVNTAEPPDTLETVESLAQFFDDHDYSGSRAGTPEELDEVRALRPRLRELLTADQDHAVDLVNAMLAEAEALPQLVRHDGWDWHLHAVQPDRPLATRIAVETAMAMIDVIRAQQMSRLGTCAADGCAGVVVDLSRNRSRRFCSTTCGNREAVAAYRSRTRNADSSAD